MKSDWIKITLWLCALAIPAALPLPAGATDKLPIRVIDDNGTTVELPAPARRIISLAPHLTEILFAIGAGDRLVGVVAHSDYPPAARKLPQVGGYNAFDMETILSLQPDLVVGWKSGNNLGQLQRLQELGLPVFINEPRHIEDIPLSALRLGKLTGQSQQAEQFSQRFNRKYRELKARYSGRKPVRLFYQIWNRPLITINGEHLISDVIRLCGAENIFAEVPTLAPTVSIEAVLVRAPEIIVTGAAEGRSDWLDMWQQWPQLPAVKEGQLYFINPDIIQRHGPRILEGAEALCALVEKSRVKRQGASDE